MMNKILVLFMFRFFQWIKNGGDEYNVTNILTEFGFWLNSIKWLWLDILYI